MLLSKLFVGMRDLVFYFGKICNLSGTGKLCGSHVHCLCNTLGFREVWLWPFLVREFDG